MNGHRPPTNTCHVCLRTLPVEQIDKCWLCSHNTCDDCQEIPNGEDYKTWVCRKCAHNPAHQHPTGHGRKEEPA